MIPIACYVCKQESADAHYFYPGLCPACGEFNLQKRLRTVDLSGFTALVTGGRIKIGFETALRLLRCGADVVLTTRFEEDAWRRFHEQPDSDQWADRLQIYAIDFRDAAATEDLTHWVCDRIGKLDILINNAAQTIRRPPAFYRHLLQAHAGSKGLRGAGDGNFVEPSEDGGSLLVRIPNKRSSSIARRHEASFVAELSQMALIPGDDVFDSESFPKGQFDKDGQQEDRRDFNSWMMRLEDVHLVEFLEVFLVNVVAPFILCSRLKGAMKKQEGQKPSFIINVSAMEGNFHDPEKNYRHPHTNMAKAAINMLTRTSAIEFSEDRIFMNCVDPGWVTDMKPFPARDSSRVRAERMAIDEVDGASRICDPIFCALVDGDFASGLLFKNYRVYPW